MKPKNEKISNQETTISSLLTQIDKLMMENMKMKQEVIYSCDECEFETNTRNNIREHRKSDHMSSSLSDCESDNAENDFNARPKFKCDRCC